MHSFVMTRCEHTRVTLPIELAVKCGLELHTSQIYHAF